MQKNSNIKILEISGEPRISHRIIAEFAETKQKNVSELIQKYSDKLELFGQLSFQIEAIKNSKNKVNEQKTYFLNEKQLGMFFIQAKIPLELSILYVKYGNSFKAIEEFLKTAKKPKNYFVYVVDFENANLKIGFTSSPQKRLRTLETQSGNKILDKEIIEFSSKQEALTYEKFLHNKFADFRTRGEYFAIKLDVVFNSVMKMKFGNRPHREKSFVSKLEVKYPPL
jgi:predicted GIY-YIG superfamily endonuclease